MPVVFKSGYLFKSLTRKKSSKKKKRYLNGIKNKKKKNLMLHVFLSLMLVKNKHFDINFLDQVEQDKRFT